MTARGPCVSQRVRGRGSEPALGRKEAWVAACWAEGSGARRMQEKLQGASANYGCWPKEGKRGRIKRKGLLF
jgi:hypothetical protein